VIGVTTGSTELDLVFRMGSALVVGLAVGLERQLHQRVAGTRTNALVAAGAAAFTMAGAALSPNPDTQARIAAQIVSGIGFLGAGVIFKEGASVHGLNTAATIWCSAAIGTLFGLGQYFLGLLTGGIVLVTNVMLRPLAYKLHPLQAPTNEQAVTYCLTVECAAQDQMNVRDCLLKKFQDTALTVYGLESSVNEALSVATVKVTVRGVGRRDALVEETANSLCAPAGISSVSWTMSIQSLD
jgi:putative Mg2+ transporter-C (MgtC) family protein